MLHDDDAAYSFFWVVFQSFFYLGNTERKSKYDRSVSERTELSLICVPSVCHRPTNYVPYLVFSATGMVFNLSNIVYLKHSKVCLIFEAMC